MKLTQRKIEQLECPVGKKDALIFDDEQRGLVVRVMTSGGKNFLAQYTLAGSKKRVPLGACSAISLAAARDAARAILGEVAKGSDPAAQRKESAREAKRKAEHESLTLDALFAQWQTIRLSDRRESYAAEAVRAVRYAFPKQLNAPAADLSRAAVVRVLDGLTKDGKAAMAARTAAYGRACYSWAVKRGSLNANPFLNLPLAPVEKRERVLTDEELRAIWQATGGPGPFNAIVRMLMLTGQRREEVAGVTWDEIALDYSVWTIPAARAKNGIAHIVPLSVPMRALIAANEADTSRGLHAREAGEREQTLVFPGRVGPFNGFGKSKAALDEASGVKEWRLHDLRRTMATGLQKLGVRLEVTEATLGHLSGSRAGIVGVYQRHDYAAEKRAALDAWGAHVAALVKGHTVEGNVVALRRGA
jgi:integrase